VWMRFRSYPSMDFKGKIDWIGPVTQTIEGQQMVPMRVKLENPDGLLKPGMTGVSKIYCGQRLIIDLMTRRLHRWIKTDFWKLW
jgi:hypothetical protein